MNIDYFLQSVIVILGGWWAFILVITACPTLTLSLDFCCIHFH